MIWIVGGLVAVVGLGWCFLMGPCRSILPGGKELVQWDDAVAENKRRIAAGQPTLTSQEFAKLTPDIPYMPAVKSHLGYRTFF